MLINSQFILKLLTIVNLCMVENVPDLKRQVKFIQYEDNFGLLINFTFRSI